MQVFDFLVILSFISIGLLAFLVFQRLFHLQFNFFDSLLIIGVFSFAIICFPLMLFGTTDNPFLFKAYIFLLTIVSLSFILYFVYRNFFKFFNLLNYYDVEESKTYRTIVIIALIGFFTYLFHAFLLPLRGYDALFIYFPDAILYSIAGYIPIFNPLNFFPVIKEPLNSLIFSYSIFLTNQLAPDGIILFTILLWAVVTYQLTLFFFPDNKNMASISFVMFLFFPLNLWFLDQWFYYQDIFLGFFFTLTIYFILKSFDSSQSLSYKKVYSFLAGLSFALSLISKFSGWILIFVLIALYLYYTSFPTATKVYYILLGSFFVLMSYANSVTILIPFIVVFFIILYYHSHNSDLNFDSFKPYRLGVIAIFALGILFGGYWFFYVFSKFGSFFGSSFFNFFEISTPSSPTTLSTTSSALRLDPSSIAYTFESAHRANIFSLVLVLVIGNLFAAFWALPKILALFKRSVLSPIILWILIFFSFWAVFDSISIRYLTPVITPLILLSLYGFLLIKSYLKDLGIKLSIIAKDTQDQVSDHFSSAWIAAILILGLLSLYFPIPLEVLFSNDRYNIARAYLATAFTYYSNWFTVLLILIGVPIFCFVVLLKGYLQVKVPHSLISSSFKKLKKYSLAVVLLIILLYPNIILFNVYASSSFNITETQRTYIYESRPEFQELINVIYSENDPTGAIMVYDTPGIPVYIGNPTFDMYSESYILNPLFISSNITLGMQILLDPYTYIATANHYKLPSSLSYPAIDYVIVPNKGNLYFNSFMHDFRDHSYLFPLLENPQLFNLVFNNSDFRLYKRLFNQANFFGPFDTGLQSSTSTVPILGLVPQTTFNGSDLTQYVNLFFPTSKFQQLNLTVQSQLNTTSDITLTNNYTFQQLSDDMFTVSWNIPFNDSFSITGLSINATVLDSQNHLANYFWSFEASTPVNIVKIKNNFLSINLNDGIKFSQLP